MKENQINGVLVKSITKKLINQQLGSTSNTEPGSKQKAQLLTPAQIKRKLKLRLDDLKLIDL